MAKAKEQAPPPFTPGKNGFGKLYDGNTLFLRLDVGKAAHKDTNETAYEFSVNVAGYHPIIRSAKTGKWFTLSWDDILKLAQEAGIDAEGN